MNIFKIELEGTILMVIIHDKFCPKSIYKYKLS